MKIIALMGPSRGGKSTIAQNVAASIEGRVVRISFADTLKEASVPRGYNYEKTNEQRCILQDVSASMKSEFGESIFAKNTLAKLERINESITTDFAIIDDLRHSVERSELLYAKRAGLIDELHIIGIKEPIAEFVWEHALREHCVESDDFTWATHRSELEWRAFRHLYPAVVNRKDTQTGLSDAVNSVLHLVGTQNKGSDDVR